MEGVIGTRDSNGTMRPTNSLLAILGLAMTASAQGPTLVAHYKLDETTGMTLADSSSQGADAALSGTYQLGTLGAAAGTAGAVTFDPTGLGMGILPDGPNLTNLRNDLSLTAWVNPLSYGAIGVARIFSGDDSAWSCGIKDNGLRFTTRNILDYNLNGQIVPLNTWTHLAWVMDASNDVTFYMNGVNVGSIAGNSPSNAPNANWVIGSFRITIAPPECFDGSIDDIQVYSGSLSDSEIAQLFAAPGSTLDGGTSFCEGDGSGTTCPCGNPGNSDSGCANSTGGGASIGTQGVASIVGQSFVLTATGMPANQLGVFFQGNNAINSGLGVPFGDGLRCVGGAAKRLQIVNSDNTGAIQTTVDIALKGGVVAGDLHHYQLWYGDPGTPCGALFNFSNATEITWQA
jgi:hypothetical protein